MEGMVINKLHFIPFNLYLCAVGKRIYWFEFRKANKVNQNGMNNKEFYIISLKYSESEKELIIIG